VMDGLYDTDKERLMKDTANQRKLEAAANYQVISEIPGPFHRALGSLPGPGKPRALQKEIGHREHKKHNDSAGGRLW